MTDKTTTHDGVHSLVPENQMCDEAKLLRDTYAVTPDTPFVQGEFGFYSIDRWAEQGMPQDIPHQDLFGFGNEGFIGIRGLGWCEASFYPRFEEKILEDRGEHELVQDYAGRHVL